MLRALALVLAAATTLALPPGARSQPPPLEPAMHSGATDADVLAPRPQRSRAGGCTGGGSGGCSPPVGDKWRRWDMAGSTYAYCYAGCPVPYLLNHSYPYAGLVGVDHYWTGQGVPCRGGKPREFDAQDELAADWKRRAAPGLRFLSYRILSAVPYDAVVQDKMAASPDYFVRWRTEPSAATKAAQHCPAGGCQAGSICQNYVAPCFNDPRRINAPSHGCATPIRAGAYDFLQPAVREWFLENVLYRTLKVADGMWLDGNGYDNGGWMCSGICCGFNSSNSPQSQQQIDGFCAAQTALATRAREHIIAKEGFDMNCLRTAEGMPTANDDAASCGSKIMSAAAWGANHSNFNAVIAYGGITYGGGGYNDTTAAGAVAAFLIARGEHWFFGITTTKGTACNPKHYPVTGRCHSDGCGKPCNSSSNQMHPDTAKLVTSDYGAPVAGPAGVAHAVPGKAGVYAREYERATVSLDCATWGASFVLK